MIHDTLVYPWIFMKIVQLTSISSYNDLFRLMPAPASPN